MVGSRPLTAGVFLALALAAATAASAGSRYDVKGAHATREALLAGERSAWKAARAISWGPSIYRTTFRALWADDGLFVRFEARDSEPWHTYTRHDDKLWNEEVVEIFLDPDRSGTHYLELEISPANVTVDVHILHPLPQNEGDPPWKADFGWDIAGLETRVGLRTRGTATEGWTATAFVPWEGLRSLPSTKQIAFPPRAGDRWRFNVFRIERPRRPDGTRGEVLLAWSPAHIPKFHVPSAFRDLVFR